MRGKNAKMVAGGRQEEVALIATAIGPIPTTAEIRTDAITRCDATRLTVTCPPCHIRVASPAPSPSARRLHPAAAVAVDLLSPTPNIPSASRGKRSTLKCKYDGVSLSST